MKSLWFVMPVHGRLKLAAICLRQLRRTCDALIAEGVMASAVIITDPRSLRELERLGGRCGFATALRDNAFLGRRFNDGIQLACDPALNPHPVDYVVPFGSDDWADYRLFLDLPRRDTLRGFQVVSFVREDGLEVSTTHLGYQGGSGIRIIPREIVEPLGYRPADEDRKRSCDTSILTNLRAFHGSKLKIDDTRHLHDRQIVDWKSPGEQLNTYTAVTRIRKSRASGDPWEVLAGVYPDEALGEMRAYYAKTKPRRAPRVSMSMPAPIRTTRVLAR